jgi:basic membrane protein A
MTVFPGKIGIVLITAVDDGGWGTAGYKGIQVLQTQAGVEIEVRDQTPLGQAQQVFTDLSKRGCSLVFGHGGELSDAIRRAAEDTPQVMFACTNGLYTTRNLAALEIKDEEVAYLAGILAGRVSAMQRVGFIGGLEICATLRHNYGYQKGALETGVDLTTCYTRDFFDPSKAKRAAERLIDQQVDVIYGYLNTAWQGVVEACRDTNCKVIEPIMDRGSGNPAVIASAVQNVGALYVRAAHLFAEGTLEGRRYRIGVEDPSVQQLALHLSDAALTAEIEATRARILKHEIESLPNSH